MQQHQNEAPPADEMHPDQQQEMMQQQFDDGMVPGQMDMEMDMGMDE